MTIKLLYQLSKLSRLCYSSKPSVKMSGLPTVEIIKRLQAFAPLSLAEKWDNVGLLVDSMNSANISTVLLTNDLTEDVVQEAIKKNAGLIVSYHPNIFQALKTVSSRTWKERIIVECIKNNISVFSPHTSWDSVEGGVNDWLVSAFPTKRIKAIEARDETGRVGAGRILHLDEKLPLTEIIALVKNHIKIPHLRLALARNSLLSAPIQTIALCAGSGHSVLNGVEADLYLTGEMLHHDLLEATQNGVSVVLCNHSDSERGFLRVFQAKLQDNILEGGVQVVVSEIDRDPIITV